MKQSKLIIYVTPAGLRQRMLVQENASVSGIRLLQKISDNVKELIPVVSQAPEGTYGRVTFVAGRQHGRRQTSGDYEVSKSASAAQARDVKKLFDNIVQACRQQEECLSCEIIPEI